MSSFHHHDFPVLQFVGCYMQLSAYSKMSHKFSTARKDLTPCNYLGDVWECMPSFSVKAAILHHQTVTSSTLAPSVRYYESLLMRPKCDRCSAMCEAGTTSSLTKMSSMYAEVAFLIDSAFIMDFIIHGVVGNMQIHTPIDMTFRG